MPGRWGRGSRAGKYTHKLTNPNFLLLRKPVMQPFSEALHLFQRETRDPHAASASRNNLKTMFKKVLVVEDPEYINMDVTSSLKAHFPFDIQTARYCDKAFVMVKKAKQIKLPFDLLITDISISDEHVKAIIKNGKDLISMVKSVQPEIRVVVYSMEDRPFKVKQLLDSPGLDGYVLKGRNGSQELVEAIKLISLHKRYITPHLGYSIASEPAPDVDMYDLMLLKELANGHSQMEISALFKSKGLSPHSLSSLEKRINKLKDHFRAKNSIHLVAIAKDMGLF